MLDHDKAHQADATHGPDGAPYDSAPPDDGPYDDEGRDDPALTDDVMALFEDGKTYIESEIAFQKSRALFSANRVKFAIIFGLGAFGVFHLALIALTVGLVIALVPVGGPWAATAIVTLLLVITGVILLFFLKKRIDDVRHAFRIIPMTDRKHRMIEDRYLRDSARALVDADIQNLKSNLSYQSVGERAVNRVKDLALDIYDEALDVAENNKGAVAAIVAAIVIWLARNPILALLGFDTEEPDEDTEFDDE